ncbi:hypothetical protein F2P81_006328 [Scophthalmus maximus]|uniref:Reverse transcriptase domain-containing protein n=1 Tax=Scophthalmus maximus TaxID=52904 RepID=A0A6A4T948_SCOMX|nr:hypothetical protein F2P81_006328 [Scophthalmus maximus]
MIVPKSDNTPRFCSDFRKVNSVTKPDSYPLPRMDGCIDKRLIHKVVVGLDGCAVYLDDVVVYSDTWSAHTEHVRALFGPSASYG